MKFALKIEFYFILFYFGKVITEKAMATHPSTLAWKIAWIEEPGGLQSMGSHRVRHNCCDLAAAAVGYKNEN